MPESGQLPLFDDQSNQAQVTEQSEQPAEELVQRPDIDKTTPLEEAVDVYLADLEKNGASRHTVKAFKSDLNLLGKYHGYETLLGQFDTAKLNSWLHWMLNERDKPCSPKTYARRVTTLKNFFGYLVEHDALKRDPSAAVVQRSVTSRLPTTLFEREIEQILSATRAMRANPDDPDARPHLLVLLLLQTGIKKAECMRLTPDDFERHGVDQQAYVYVRYDKSNMRYKERRIPIGDNLLDVLEAYMLQRKPEGGVVFDCTPRNLEYVLRDVAVAAGVPPSKVSFESLRWTCALRDFLNQMDEEELREKMGLSRISWRQTSDKLGQLADRIG